MFSILCFCEYLFNFNFSANHFPASLHFKRATRFSKCSQETEHQRKFFGAKISDFFFRLSSCSKIFSVNFFFKILVERSESKAKPLHTPTEENSDAVFQFDFQTQIFCWKLNMFFIHLTDLSDLCETLIYHILIFDCRLTIFSQVFSRKRLENRANFGYFDHIFRIICLLQHVGFRIS